MAEMITTINIFKDLKKNMYIMKREILTIKKNQMEFLILKNKSNEKST